MACAERGALWGYAAGELPVDEKALLEAHLEICPECREELGSVRATRELLSLAAPVAPKVDWSRADAMVHQAAEEHLSRRPWWQFDLDWTWTKGLALGCGVAAMALAIVTVSKRNPVAVPDGLELVKVVPTPSAVEAAEGVVATYGKDEHLLKAGEDVKAGATLKTTVTGRAMVKLPEGSRVRVAASTDVFFQKAGKDEVGLVLNKGRVAVKATHAPRTAFVVQANGVSVRVVGTAFSVGMTDDHVDVAVSEGRVLVDLPNNQSRMVSAGERVQIDRAQPEMRSAGLTLADKDEMAELGVPVVLAEAPKAKPVVVARGPVAAPVPAPVPAPQPEVVVVPVPAKPDPEPAVSVRRPEIVGFTAEVTRMRQIEHRHLGSGNACQEDLLVLQEYLEEAEDPLARQYARVLRARCLLRLSRRVEAESEYRRYIEEFPKGQFKDEAHEYLPH